MLPLPSEAGVVSWAAVPGPVRRHSGSAAAKVAVGPSHELSALPWAFQVPAITANNYAPAGLGPHSNGFVRILFLGDKTCSFPEDSAAASCCSDCC